MDPVSLIIAALAAGAVAGAQGTATSAVTDAYVALKALVKQRFANRTSGEIALDQHEKKPEQWEKALEAELIDARSGDDDATVSAARWLLELVDPAGARAGKYLVDLRGAQGVQVGDRNVQTNQFGRTGPS